MPGYFATQILRDDHKVLRGLFRQVEAADKRAPEMKDGVVAEILMLLEVHTQLEEEIFYPAVIDATEPTDPLKALVEGCISDHHAVKESIVRIRGAQGDLARVNLELLELIPSVEEHVEKEETELFSGAEKSLGNLLEVLGERIHARREQLLAQPKYKGARPSEVQDPNGGEQMRKTA